MGRLFRGIFYLLVIAGIGLAGYAYLGDLEPERSETRLPVTLDAR
ncbi:hypothetical protein [Alkalilacustris brevis]|nr:hypothetical protein [Alkalilacustris brevis]